MYPSLASRIHYILQTLLLLPNWFLTFSFFQIHKHLHVICTDDDLLCSLVQNTVAVYMFKVHPGNSNLLQRQTGSHIFIFFKLNAILLFIDIIVDSTNLHWCTCIFFLDFILKSIFLNKFSLRISIIFCSFLYRLFLLYKLIIITQPFHWISRPPLIRNENNYRSTLKLSRI